jgi:hypothetical protein
MTTTEQKWAARVTEWRASGLTALACCEGKPFKPGGLRYWSSVLGRRNTAQQVRIARVVRTSEAVPSTDTPIVIEVGAMRVAIRRGVDVEALRVVLSALGSGR